MNKTIKIKVPAVKTHAEMETLVSEITALKLNEKLLTASMDAEIQAVRASYEGRLGTLTQVLAEKTAAACAWAEAHPAAFGARRSVEFIHGIVGFRLGPPKFKLLLKNKTEDVLEFLRGVAWGPAFIRVKEEINKEQIIASISAHTLSEVALRQAGAQVVREESFYVEPKLTRTENREMAQAA